MSPLSNNLRRGALTLIHNQTIWLDYHPHNQIRCLWADYHRGAQQPAVFGLRYSLHIEALCDGPAVCGKPVLGSVLWLCVCVCVRVKGSYSYYMACCTHRQRNRREAFSAAGHSRGDGMKVVCLYDVAVVKCHNASCRVCKRVPKSCGTNRISSWKCVVRRVEGTWPKNRKEKSSMFFFFFIPRPADLKCCGQTTTRTNKQTEKTLTHIFNFFSSSSSSFCPSICASQGYQISYRLDSRDPLRWTTVEVGSNARQFTVTGLLPEQTYVFKLVSRTAVGWGQEKEALVVTTERRGKRRRPSSAANISHRVGLPWTPHLMSPEMDLDEMKPPPLRFGPTAAPQWVDETSSSLWSSKGLLVLSILLLRQDSSGSPWKKYAKFRAN